MRYYITEEHQSADNHCVTVMAVENRVSKIGVLKLENGKCIRTSCDNAKLLHYSGWTCY